jgi:hypothetical protein
MKAGKETEMYNQGYMDGYEDGENAHIEPILPKIKGVTNDDPDYWTRLEHQYAGMAMQQLVTLVNVGYEYVYEETAIIAMNFAHALVEAFKIECK